MSVELKAANKKLLELALKALKLTFTVRADGVYVVHTPQGNMTISNDTASGDVRTKGWVDKIKQAYSLENVKFSAKKYGFNVVQKGKQLVLRKY